MPLYEYECHKCGRRFEVLVSAHKAQAQRCEECGGRCRRLLSPPAIIFKGSGFYTTDYARAGKSGGGDGGSPEKKPEKPAKKAEDKKAEPKA